jgi:hypothetical protein
MAKKVAFGKRPLIRSVSTGMVLIQMLYLSSRGGERRAVRPLVPGGKGVMMASPCVHVDQARCH